MSACLARSIELKRQLSHIKKKESQTIDQYLLEVKLLADNLNSINSPVSNRDVIEYTINGLGPDYESLISIISYIPGNATIESLRPVLLAQEQRNQFLRSQDPAPAHQAFAAAPAVPAGQNRGGAAPAARGQGGRAPAGRGYRGGRGRGQRGRGRGYGVQFQQQQPAYGHQQAPLLPLPNIGQYGPLRGQAPAGNPGSVLCNLKSGYSYLNHIYTCGTNNVSAGFPSGDNSHFPQPPVICQICFSPGHSTLTCPRFVGSSAPALAALPSGESNSVVWYPDSGASAHMTPHEGQSDGGASSSGFQ
ncbi:unnamed protein product [Cuscuta epithymum]|uniref:Uncharacterized protein n=1 Tax=Cuscuta epithymum TaxID=186058 RepID=A0AAV0DNJ7_9ASTE|nr:unnamed protein product [Cuscuta epithymum]